MSGRSLLSCLLVPLALALAVRPAGAQEVRGQVVERGSGTPLGGALVTLLSEDGEEAGRTLTAPDGAYRIQAPAGSYRLRVERIGFATWTSEAFRLQAGEPLTRPVEVPTQAVPLTSLAVEAEGRCRTRPEAGQAAARLWEEARKALRATEVTREERETGFRVRRYERLLTAGLDTVEERSTVAGGVTGSPFEAVPLETLEEDWFVHREREGGYRFYAPDAAALLSDAFAEGHCFRVREAGRDSALVGLGFEPSGGAEGALEGTLWLDRESSRLSHLEFGYPNLDLGEHVDTDGLDGRVDFEQLEDGSWIVRRWRIRMPRLERGWVETLTKRELATTLLGYEEEGGEVLAASEEPATTIRRRPPRIVTGTVHDSVAGEPLAGARVSVENASLSTRTDEAGSFRIDARDAAFDELLLRVEHPRLDLLGVTIERRVVVRPGQIARLSLGTPGVTTLLRARCPDGERTSGTGTVIGLVGRAGTDEPADDVPVVLTWEGAEEPVEVRTEPGGFYRACGLPGGAEVSVRAGGVPGRAADAVRVRVPTDGLVKVDLEVGGP